MEQARKGLVSGYITDALLILISKKPFEDISITELCAKAGVTRMSFYRNFSDKEDVLRRMIRKITDGFLEESKISYSSDTLEQYLVKLFGHMQRNQETLELISKAGMLHLVKDEFERVFLAAHRNEYDEYKSCFLAGGMFNAFRLWLERGCREGPEELSRKLNDILSR